MLPGMNGALFSGADLDRLAADVTRLLGEIGFVVDHPEARTSLLAAGCRESATGRILFDPGQIAELRPRLSAQGPAAPELVHPRRELRLGIGNITPKYYDYAAGRARGGDTAALVEITKFAQAEGRVRSLTLPISRQDVPPSLEQIEAVLVMARHTDKPLGGVDATMPGAVRWLAEMGQALGAPPADFVGACNCVNPPLRLERRTLETMLERRRYHSLCLMTSMPCLGGSSPVDIRGSVVLGTAEVVGSLIVAAILDPEAPLRGYIACTQIDMRSGLSTSSTPQTVRFDAGVYQLMRERFGGGTAVGGRSYISAKRPGLQAAVERFLKAVGYAALVDRGAISYAGNGNLDNGSVFCAEQLLLDFEVLGGLDCTFAAPEAPEADNAYERIRDLVSRDGANALTAEHTLEHYRDELWAARYTSGGLATPTEAETIARCHADFCATVGSYRPASHPPEVLRELERILTRARNALER